MKREVKRQSTIDLAAPPRSWNQLSSKQLIAIYRLMNKGYKGTEYKVRVLMMLLGLVILKHADKNDDGTFTYQFRRKGLWPWLKRERLSMCSWEVHYWIDKYLKYLDEPFTRTMAAWEYKRIRGRKFKAPDSLLLNMTYQQFNNCQRSLVNYWNAQRMVQTMLDNGATKRGMREALRKARNARAAFLSHLFIAGRRQVMERKDDSTYLSMKKVYRYDQRTAQRNAWRFRDVDPAVFDVCMQLYQSTLSHYKNLFPMLFKEHTGNDGKSTLAIELETINVVKRECGYDSQQAVYDTNAVFIFEDLNMLASKAKQIEDMNRKMKTKK